MRKGGKERRGGEEGEEERTSLGFLWACVLGERSEEGRVIQVECFLTGDSAWAPFFSNSTLGWPPTSLLNVTFEWPSFSKLYPRVAHDKCAME